MPRRILVDPKRAFAFRHPGRHGSDRDRSNLGGVEIGDVQVQVGLLRNRVVRPRRRHMIGSELEGQAGTAAAPNRDPVVVLPDDPPAK